MTYIKQLDGLRFLAVSLVIFSHWAPQDYLIIKTVPWGFVGVNLFFVISGFLITRILVESRYVNGASKGSILKNFIARRSLRIFPLYYFTLLFFLAINYNQIRDHAWPYILYYCNFDYFANNAMDGLLSPRWSLAVEEQFYLIWPWIILFLNRKYLPGALLSTVILSLVARVLIVLFYPSNGFTQFLTISNLDSFGLGGLLAYTRVFPNEKGFDFNRYSSVFLIIGLLLLGFNSFIHLEGEFRIVKINLKAIGCTLFSIGLVSLVVLGRIKGFMATILQNKLVVYLGKISYGLYLYHSMVFLILGILGINTNLFFSKNLTGIIALFIISSLSWYLFEKPVNNLKRYFEY